MSRKIIDHAIFTTVQPHYVVPPIFQDMDDPLSQRSGFLEGEADTVTVPKIPKPPPKPQNANETIVLAKPLKLEQFDKIVDWTTEHEPGKGERNDYWGAMAGFLKRQGIRDEDVGEIVYEGATASNDEQARDRQKSALNACHRIDNGMPMTGLQTLIKEFGVDDSDEIIELIGTKKVDPEDMIKKLTKKSEAKEIEAVLKHLVGLSSTETEKMLKKIKKETDVSLQSLKRDLLRIQRSSPGDDNIFDYGEAIARQTLAEHFESGENLLRVNKRYMGYNGKFWEEMPDDYISGLVLPFAENTKKIHTNLETNLSDLVGQASRIIKWRSSTKGDALRMLKRPYPVINTPNAEIWLHKDGNLDVLPHTSDSFQFGCINVPYEPKAECPVFDRTLLEIFAENDEPEEMVRHFYEFIAYSLQPMRDIAVFGMMIGASNCGKSKISETVSRLLGHESILHMKLEAFKDKDAIGNLLGKRLVVDDDLTQGVVFPDGIVKMFSEEKRVTGELKYQNKFPFLSYALLLMIGNQYPRIFKTDYSIKRRALIFPFKRTFQESEDNRDLFPGIWANQQEMSGILNRCIEAYQRLRKRGHFEQPKECKYAYDEWVSGCTFISRFINEVCQPNNDGPNQTWQNHVKILYEWADAEDIKVNMNPKELRKVYELSGVKFGSTGGSLTVKGIKAPDLLDLPL